MGNIWVLGPCVNYETSRSSLGKKGRTLRLHWTMVTALNWVRFWLNNVSVLVGDCIQSEDHSSRTNMHPVSHSCFYWKEGFIPILQLGILGWTNHWQNPDIAGLTSLIIFLTCGKNSGEQQHYELDKVVPCHTVVLEWGESRVWWKEQKTEPLVLFPWVNHNLCMPQFPHLYIEDNTDTVGASIQDATVQMQQATVP